MVLPIHVPPPGWHTTKQMWYTFNRNYVLCRQVPYSTSRKGKKGHKLLLPYLPGHQETLHAPYSVSLYPQFELFVYSSSQFRYSFLAFISTAVHGPCQRTVLFVISTEWTMVNCWTVTPPRELWPLPPPTPSTVELWWTAELWNCSEIRTWTPPLELYVGIFP